MRRSSNSRSGSKKDKTLSQAEFDRQMAMAREIMRERFEALRALAKP